MKRIQNQQRDLNHSASPIASAMIPELLSELQLALNSKNVHLFNSGTGEFDKMLVFTMD